MRSIIKFFAIFIIGMLILILSLDAWISFRAKDRIFYTVPDTPTREIGLVLGTSKYIGKTLNSFYMHRINAAQTLFYENKINVLLLSGDNAHRSYNEPWTMKRDMLRAGIPEDKIYLDYAGFRTLDSIIRAKEIFNADKLTIITQGFHCERALFISDYYGLDTICYAVKTPDGLDSFKIRLREIFARVKAVIDIYLLNKQPRFLGPKEIISLS